MSNSAWKLPLRIVLMTLVHPLAAQSTPAAEFLPPTPRVRYVGFDEATCGQWVHLSLEFPVPEGFVIKPAQYDCLWGRKENLDRLDLTKDGVDYSDKKAPVIRITSTFDVGYRKELGKFIFSIDGKTEDDAQELYKKERFNVIKSKRLTFGFYPAWELIAESRKQRIYILYIATLVETNTLAIFYIPPRGESAAGQSGFEALIAGIRGEEPKKLALNGAGLTDAPAQLSQALYAPNSAVEYEYEARVGPADAVKHASAKHLFKKIFSNEMFVELTDRFSAEHELIYRRNNSDIRVNYDDPPWSADEITLRVRAVEKGFVVTIGELSRSYVGDEVINFRNSSENQFGWFYLLMGRDSYSIASLADDVRNQLALFDLQETGKSNQFTVYQGNLNVARLREVVGKIPADGSDKASPGAYASVLAELNRRFATIKVWAKGDTLDHFEISGTFQGQPYICRLQIRSFTPSS